MMRPNILFILTDQFRADALGCVGGWTRTPNLDALTELGCLFTNTFANSAECIPSRISLATGLYPHQTGVDRNRRCTLNPATRNWMRGIADAGYETSVFGKTHLHPHEGDLRDRLPLLHQYGLQTVDETAGPHASATVRSNMTDLWESLGYWEPYRRDVSSRSAKPQEARPTCLPLEVYYDRYVGEAALRHIEKLSAERAWFCWVSFGGPHEPWDAPEPYASMYDPDAMPAPAPRIADFGKVDGLLKRAYRSSNLSPMLTGREIGEMRANYAGNVTLIDDEIGRILDLLRSRGDLQRTAIIFTSDHGEMNGDHGLIYKANFLDPAIKVPLIVVPPESDSAPWRGQSSLAIAELMDVGATILDYAGAELAPTMQARSLRGAVERRRSEHRGIAVCEFAGHSCVISGRYKAEFDETGKAMLLFDRQGDAKEQCNLVYDAAHTETLAGLRRNLDEFRAATPALPGVLLEDEKVQSR